MFGVDMTSIGHVIILGGVIAAYVKSKNVENLIETQQQTINALQKGFEACKDNLAQLEKRVKKGGSR
jgi:hypothetical protein